MGWAKTLGICPAPGYSLLRLNVGTILVRPPRSVFKEKLRIAGTLAGMAPIGTAEESWAQQFEAQVAAGRVAFDAQKKTKYPYPDPSRDPLLHTVPKDQPHHTFNKRGNIIAGTKGLLGVSADVSRLLKLQVCREAGEDYVIENVEEHLVSEKIFQLLPDKWSVALTALDGKLDWEYYLVTQVTIASSVTASDHTSVTGGGGVTVPTPAGPVDVAAKLALDSQRWSKADGATQLLGFNARGLTLQEVEGARCAKVVGSRIADETKSMRVAMPVNKRMGLAVYDYLSDEDAAATDKGSYDDAAATDQQLLADHLAAEARFREDAINYEWELEELE